jgi:hypothetical protein
MTVNNVEKFFSAVPDVVYEAALRASATLGYELLHTDATRRTLSFETTSPTTSEVNVSVACVGSGSRVVVIGIDPTSPLAARGRLVWAVSVPNRFIKALTEMLLQPSAGWLPDPSGRFAQRWWDGCGWTERARDHERGTQFEDPPGSLAAPSALPPT